MLYFLRGLATLKQGRFGPETHRLGSGGEERYLATYWRGYREFLSPAGEPKGCLSLSRRAPDAVIDGGRRTVRQTANGCVANARLPWQRTRCDGRRSRSRNERARGASFHSRRRLPENVARRPLGPPNQLSTGSCSSRRSGRPAIGEYEYAPSPTVASAFVVGMGLRPERRSSIAVGIGNVTTSQSALE